MLLVFFLVLLCIFSTSVKLRKKREKLRELETKIQATSTMIKKVGICGSLSWICLFSQGVFARVMCV